MKFHKILKKPPPFIIAGPCSAESKSQILNTAKELCDKSLINVFRAGIWKPRTRANNFEGVGEIGLSWLKEVKETYKIPVITEVANTKHVESCLNNNIDMIRIINFVAGWETTCSSQNII